MITKSDTRWQKYKTIQNSARRTTNITVMYLANWVSLHRGQQITSYFKNIFNAE